jgi:hypothetical protein
MVMNDELIQSLKHRIDAQSDKVVIDDKLVQGFKNQVAVLTNLRDTVEGALGRATNQYDIVKHSLGKKLVDVIPADKPKK